MCRELHTQEIVYHKETGIMRFYGTTIIKEPTGEIIAAEKVELDKDLEKAIVKALIVILNDASKIRAENGSKNGHLFSFDNATYTPCKESHCSSPLWDLASDNVVYDSKKKSFIYRNVRMRFKGIPILFLPYFKHPAFGVRRQSGFLSPVLRSNKEIGVFLGIPYFFVLGDDKDLKLTPFLNSKLRGFAAGEYRQVFSKGDFNISASILTKASSDKDSIDDREKKTRWHIDSIFKSYNLDNKRLTVRLNRSSDVTYKLKYPVEDRGSGFLWQRRYNESKISMEFFDKDYFIATDSMLFQTPEKNTAPLIIPHFSIIKRQKESSYGTVEFQNDTFYLSRNNEKLPNFTTEFFRSSNRVSWNKRVTVGRVAFNFLSGIKGDIFNAKACGDGAGDVNKIYPVFENQISGFVPLVSTMSTDEQISIWGPKITVSSVESFGNRKNTIQNEDSVLSSANDLNLHSINRFGAFDRIEEGERVSVGIENSIYNAKRRWLHFFIGNSQTIREPRTENKLIGRNDAVGRVVLKPCDNVSWRTKFVGVPIIGKSKMFESGVNITVRKVETSVCYIHDSRTNLIRDSKVAQLGVSVSIDITKFWKVSLSKITSLKKGYGARNLLHSLFLDYRDECFGMGFGIHKSRFSDNEIKPSVGIIFVLSFKNLGNISKSAQNYLYKTELWKID
jgi:LPS-assembly protein